MFKRIISLTFLVVTFVLVLTHPVTTITNIGFNDIDNSKYKGSIIELYEEGVVCGTKNGQFEPKREITIYEFCAMLARAFYPDEDYSVTTNNQEWFTPYVNKLQSEGIISKYSYWLWENGQYSADSFIETILVTAEYYNRPLDIYNYTERIKQTALDSGLIQKDYDCTKKMLREEAADLINKVVHNNFSKIEYIAEFPVEYKLDNFRGMDEVFRKNLLFLKTIPIKFTELFNKKGYTYLITNQCEDYYPELKNSDGNVIGITDYNRKIICIERDSDLLSVQHEFGHIVASELIDNENHKILDLIYAQEKNSIARFTRDYALSNADECFAEAFGYLLKNYNDVIAIQKFRKECPLTTQIIYDNIINYDGFINFNKINEINIERK